MPTADYSVVVWVLSRGAMLVLSLKSERLRSGDFRRLAVFIPVSSSSSLIRVDWDR